MIQNNQSIGKRKTSIAILRIFEGTGIFTINNKSCEEYINKSNILKNLAFEPLYFLNLQNKFDIIILVSGGGKISQLEAIRLALSKLLIKINPKFRAFLKCNQFLRRDARIKERRKYGFKKARKKPQYSKR
jgi:small subunit ribosomal protein S9